MTELEKRLVRGLGDIFKRHAAMYRDGSLNFSEDHKFGAALAFDEAERQVHSLLTDLQEHEQDQATIATARANRRR